MKQVLEFVLQGQHYGVDILSVVEVIAPLLPAPVFHTPAYVLGIMNLRGVVVALLDSAHFFDLPRTETTANSHILILRSRESGVEQECGFIVDGVVGARWVDPSRIHPPPSTISAAIREYIFGVLEEPRGPLTLLSADKIFVSEKVASL